MKRIKQVPARASQSVALSVALYGGFALPAALAAAPAAGSSPASSPGSYLGVFSAPGPSSTRAFTAVASQTNRADVDAAKTRILALIDPAVPERVAPRRSAPGGRGQENQATQAPNDLTEAIAKLISRGESHAVWNLGIGAVPALRTLADNAKIGDLLQAHVSTSPLIYLVRLDPGETLDYYAARLGDDIDRFRVLAFLSEGGLIGAAKQLDAQARSSEETIQLFDRACSHEGLDLPFRVRLGMEALGLGISSPTIESLLLGNLPMWTTDLSGSTERLAALYVGANGLPGPNVAPNVAEILWGHSLEMDRALAANRDPEVRVAFARSLVKISDPAGSPAAMERAPLLVQLALNESTRLRPEYWKAVEHLLRPTTGQPLLPLDVLAQLIERSEADAAISNKLVVAIRYQIQHAIGRAGSVTEAQWTAIIRAIAACKIPRLRSGYLQAIDHFLDQGPAVIAYAKVMLESGVLPQIDFEDKVHRSSFMDDAEEAVTRLRLVEIFLDDVEQCSPMLISGKPFCNLTKEHLPAAVRVYRALGPHWDKMAANDSSVWMAREPGALRALCTIGDLPWEERAIAAVGLLNSKDAEDGALAAKVLTTEATAGDRLQRASRLIQRRPNFALRGEAWAEWVAVTLEAAPSRPELIAALHGVEYIDSATADQAGRIVRAAGGLAKMDAEQRVLPYLAASLTQWMAADPALCDDDLILALLGLGSKQYILAKVHDLALTRPKIRTKAMAIFLGDVRTEHSTSGLVFSMIRFANEDEMNALVDAVTVSPSKGLLESLEQTLTSRARLRAAQLAWSSASVGAPTKAATIQKVLAMLASENEDVRVEAILGLGTLGAVETLPALIEIIGSGTARERTAAKESLTFLREQAKAQATAPEGASKA